ncbi:MAG: polyprenyl synthetase family protein [Myxococcota bacterium]
MTRSDAATGSGDASSLDAVVGLLGEVETLMHRLATEQGGEALGAIVGEHLDAGGKRLRARLALAAIEALGGDASGAIGWGAACELLHNATLVHDDLQDGDRLRRGKPTVWVQHGVAQAVNAGDLLFLAPLLAIDALDVSAETRWRLSRALALRGSAVIRGQADELSMALEGRTEPTTYLQTVIGKTSGLFELPVEGAAILCGRSPDDAARLACGFRPLGVLFQLQDDVLDLYGDKGRDAPGADLREGKISALIVEHLTLVPGERSWLIALLKKPRHATGDHEVRDAMARFRRSGALRAVCDRIEHEARAVRDAGVFVEQPRLGSLARALVATVLGPIRMVLEE